MTEKIVAAVEKYRDLILNTERHIWTTPETGYKEFKTSGYMEERFRDLGYDIVKADGITGFYARLDTGREGPELLILAELDSILCASHKDADPATGAVHSCGHNAQCAAFLGVAAALKERGMLDGLCGAIRLCAVPAEELLEIEYRSKLKDEGKIKYFCGKSEFLHRGYFDGVDLAFMVHTSRSFTAGVGSVGCIVKRILYKGVAAHAGSSPWNGKNALYAATCGLQAVNALRETFKEEDLIRVHPIITNGGSMVNAIPDMVTMESYIRGVSFAAMEDANKKVNRALIGAAYSIGANIEIIDRAGYSPLNNNTDMLYAAKEAYETLFSGEEFTVTQTRSTGSTDMGDLCCIMPVIHPYAPGAEGTSHGSDYVVADPEAACVKNAKWQLSIINTLLGNGAERAKKIVAEYRPLFDSKEAYFAYVDSLTSSGERIIYNDDGTAFIK